MKRGLILMVMALFSFLGTAVGTPGTAHASAAQETVKSKQTTLFELLRRSSPSNDQKVGAIFDEMLDYATLAQASLGSEWAARSDAEKQQFSDLLKQLVRKAYERNLRKTLDFNIEYVGEEQAGAAIVVKTRAVSKVNKREEPISIDYKMSQKDGSWHVQDIITEDVSLVSSYRSQFTKIIRKDGFAVLIQKMKDKLAKGDV